MPRKSLRPHLNQIRAWVRQGRTDAWIAHQLDVTASQLRDFRRRNGLTADGETPPTDTDLRDEIEAEIEKAVEEEEAAAPEPDDDGDEEADDDEEAADDERPARSGDRGASRGGDDSGDPKRRRRRGGRGRTKRKAPATLEATFDHGKEGYGLWLDAAVKDEAVYTENWAGKRELKVTIEPERIVLERVGNGKPDAKRGSRSGGRGGSGSRGGGSRGGSRGGGSRGGGGGGGSRSGGSRGGGRSRSN